MDLGFHHVCFQHVGFTRLTRANKPRPLAYSPRRWIFNTAWPVYGVLLILNDLSCGSKTRYFGENCLPFHRNVWGMVRDAGRCPCESVNSATLWSPIDVHEQTAGQVHWSRESIDLCLPLGAVGSCVCNVSLQWCSTVDSPVCFTLYLGTSGIGRTQTGQWYLCVFNYTYRMPWRIFIFEWTIPLNTENEAIVLHAPAGTPSL